MDSCMNSFFWDSSSNTFTLLKVNMVKNAMWNGSVRYN
jgi:hypothetical protein